ncbi:MAG TPA: NACHT domain-containing protein [Candidatus Glassbacteria bacterium]|nr:NACHT domain-containing protein [Candidatus Glassbacteria bacterium]
MEPWLIEGIISGVVANGLSTIVLSMGDKSQNALQYLFRKDSELDKTLKKAIQSVTNAAELDDEQKAEKLRTFLSSPDVESIVRQIYANKLTEDEDVNYLKSIHEEFLVGLSLYLGEPEKNVEDLADQIFDVLLESCDYALTAAIEEGNLFAHEAKSSLRQTIIIGELAVIKKNLDFLTANHKINIQGILDFEKKYLAQVEKRHWYIIPSYFNEAQKLPISDVFVNPTFIPLPKKEGEHPNELDMRDFLSNVYRSVVLGNPGGGKSTLSLKLCHDLAEHYSKRILAGRQVLPILVVLRDYDAEKKDCKCSILQFIETMVNSKYQIKPPNGAFEYLLLNGRAVVIFDGLDELIETECRQQISDDIESFCNLYPSVPVLVTSREVGYRQAPLDRKTFDHFQLAPFNEEQVKEYVTNWFNADTDLTKKQNKQKIDSFIKESNNVSDFLSNPLMLALMCNIYRGENYIPKNRSDVYEKCSLMLFEQWDKRRGIRVELQIESHIKPAMMYLAHWIYSDNRLQGGVTEKKLVKRCAGTPNRSRAAGHDVPSLNNSVFI